MFPTNPEKSVVLFKAVVRFIWSPADGVISALPPPVAITSEEIWETPDHTSESEEGSQRT